MNNKNSRKSWTRKVFNGSSLSHLMMMICFQTLDSIIIKDSIELAQLNIYIFEWSGRPSHLGCLVKILMQLFQYFHKKIQSAARPQPVSSSHASISHFGPSEVHATSGANLGRPLF